MFMRQNLPLFFRTMIYYPRKRSRRFDMIKFSRVSLSQVASYNLEYPKKRTQSLDNAMGFKTIATIRNLQMKDDFDMTLEKNLQNDKLTDALSQAQLIKYSVGYLRSIKGNNADYFLKIIRCERELNLEAVKNIIHNYIFLQKRIKWTYKEKETVYFSNDFLEFLNAVQKFLPELSITETLSAFCCCVNFNLPVDNELTIQIALRLLSEIQNVPFDLAVLIYHTMVFNSYKCGSELILKLQNELREKIESHISKHVANFSESDLTQAIYYINMFTESPDHWPEDVIASLLDASFDANNEIWKNRRVFYHCYNLIDLLNEDKKSYYQEKFFNKLYECLSINEHTSSFCKFLHLYAFQVFVNNAPYNAKLLDDIIFTILSNRTKLHQIKELTYSLEVVGHARYQVLDRIKIIVTEHPSIVSNSFIFLKSFISLLVDWNSLESKRTNWPETRTFIDYLLLLNDVSQWETADRVQYLRLMVALASVKIFPDEALNFLSAKSGEVALKDKFVIPYLYVSLNQAVTLMHPTYPKPFVSQDLISSTVKIMRDRSGIPEKLKLFTENVKDVLESIIPGENCVLVNKFTKLGHKINLAVAIDDCGRFFNFPPEYNDPDLLYIEDIRLNPGYEYVMILTLLETHYIRNLFSLRSVANIRVKTLELLGYKTIYILLDKWKSFTTEQKKEYIVKKVKQRKKSSFSHLGRNKI